MGRNFLKRNQEDFLEPKGEKIMKYVEPEIEIVELEATMITTLSVSDGTTDDVTQLPGI